MRPCLSDIELNRLHARELPDAERDAAREHLASCVTCARRNAELLGAHEKIALSLRALGVEAKGADPNDVARPRQIEPTGASIENEATRLGAAFTIPGEAPGEMVGRYKLLKQIGEGGFGVVWLAERRELIVQRVALKVIKPGMDTRAVIARFEQERQALAVMDHPYVAKVIDAGATRAGRPYFVMEHVAGDPITDYADSHNLSIRQRLELFISVCEAVQHAHHKGLIHRDLKPSNILVQVKDGRPLPKVIDFGVAKAISHTLTDKTIFTETGQIVGTPEYMSPEQAELGAMDVDTRTDVYSLGVVLYVLLSGFLPFDSKSLRAAGYDGIRKVLREQDAPKPSTRLSSADKATGDGIARHRVLERGQLTRELRRELDWIVVKCLEKDRTRRYETASGLALEIRRYLNDEPILAGPPRATYRIRKFVRRNRVAVISGSLIAAALVLGLIGTTWGVFWARNERDRAEVQRIRAQASEALALQRAEQTQQVAEFHVGTLRTIDLDELGKHIQRHFREKIKLRLEQQSVGEFLDQRKRTPQEVDSMLRGFDEAALPGISHDVARSVINEFMLRNATERLRREFPDLPWVRAKLHVAMGRTYRALGFYVEAESELRAALDLAEPTSQDELMHFATSMYDLAASLQDKGDFGAAEPLFRKALTLRGEHCPDGDPAIAASLHGLGMLLFEKGQRREGETMCREALALRAKRFGERHPDVAQSKNGLAKILQHAGDLQAAEAFFQDALSIWSESPGCEYLRPTVLNNLAALRAQQGDSERAEKLYAEALIEYRKWLGDEHVGVAATLTNLADDLANRDPVGAERLYREALARYRALVGDAHPAVATTLNNLGVLFLANDDYSAAEPVLQRALALRRARLGDLHLDVAQSLRNLAVVYFNQGNYAAAEPGLRAALSIRAAKLGPAHSTTIETQVSLATALFRTDRIAEAVEMLVSARDALLRESGSSPANIRTVFRALAQVYDGWHAAEPDQGYDAKAAEWRAKLAEWQASTQPAS